MPVIWTPTTDGNWNTAADWSNLKIPGAADDVAINGQVPFTVTINDFETAKSLAVGFNTGSAVRTTLSIASGGIFTIDQQNGSTGLTFGGLGTLSLAGTLLSTTLTGGYPQVIAAGGTLDGDTWHGPLLLNGGALHIKDGLTLTEDYFIGAQTTFATGTLVVSNTDLIIDDAVPLNGYVVDLAAASVLSLNGASGIFGPLEVVQQTLAGSVAQVVGVVNNQGLINLAASSGASALFNSSTITNSGVITVGAGETVTFETELDNIGAVNVGANGILIVGQGRASNLGGTFNVTQASTLFVEHDANGAGTINLSVFGVADLDNFASGFVDFNDKNGTLKLETPHNFTGTIGGFRDGDKIDSVGTTVTSASWANNVLTLHNADATTSTLNLVGAYAGATFMAVTDGNAAGSFIESTNAVGCFRAGTRIETTQGPVAVEDLCIGDDVETADGELLSIVWLGHRRIDLARHPHPEQARPFRIRGGAFGPNMPARDLWLSPDHAVFVEGALIPVKYLAEPGAIEQVALSSVDYWHVELERHAVVLAEGLPAESYLDTGQRADISETETVTTLHPSFAVRAWEADGCAPLVVSGPVIERTRAMLHARGEIAVAA